MSYSRAMCRAFIIITLLIAEYGDCCSNCVVMMSECVCRSGVEPSHRLNLCLLSRSLPSPVCSCVLFLCPVPVSCSCLLFLHQPPRSFQSSAQPLQYSTISYPPPPPPQYLPVNPNQQYTVVPVFLFSLLIHALRPPRAPCRMLPYVPSVW